MSSLSDACHRRRHSRQRERVAKVFWAYLLAFGVALPLDSAAASPLPSAEELKAEIDAKGAKEVVARLYAANPGPNGQNDWGRVTDLMALGRAAYIRLAPELAPGTDAGTSEELGISLAFALPKAPMTVLRTIDLTDGPTLGVSRVCGKPFIEGTIDDLSDYVRRAQAAVGNVEAPELQAAKTACLAALRQ